MGYSNLPISPQSVALPVELTLFRASLLPNQTTRLDWQTASELNNRGFDIERSQDGSNWRTIGFVEGHGTTNVTREYQYIDPAPKPGVNYYRLRQIDFDGRWEHSVVRSVVVESTGGAELLIYPNPIGNGMLNLNFSSPLEQGTATFRLFDANGKLLHREILTQQYNQSGYGNLPAGIYFIEVTSGYEIWRERLIVQ